jgi:hypothetical protein
MPKASKQFIYEPCLLDKGSRNVGVSRRNRPVLGHAVGVLARDLCDVGGFDRLVSLQLFEGRVHGAEEVVAGWPSLN